MGTPAPLEANHSAAWRRLGCIGLVLAGSLMAARVSAKLCGDDVDGEDVPCACGDIVVSSVALDADPVVRGAPCAHDGLVVRAPESRRAVIVDLRGGKLRGSGAGTGIRIIAGGPGGGRVISSGAPAAIAGFADGIVARGSDTVALIEDVVVDDSRRDGLRISGPDFEIRRVEVRGAKRDGFVLGGRGFRIAQTRAEDCGRFGYSVMGHAGQIGRSGSGNVAERSGDAGFNIMGGGHALADCTAAFGRKSGVHLQALDLDVRGCRATDNGGDGIEGVGSQWRIADNQALRNAGDGIAVRGVGLLDEGGNRGAGNRGGAGTREVVQCAISGTPCAL
jgi:hypothetical protein